MEHELPASVYRTRMREQKRTPDLLSPHHPLDLAAEERFDDGEDEARNSAQYASERRHVYIPPSFTFLPVA
jgi:hypothetical protein